MDVNVWYFEGKCNEQMYSKIVSIFECVSDADWVVD